MLRARRAAARIVTGRAQREILYYFVCISMQFRLKNTQERNAIWAPAARKSGIRQVSADQREPTRVGEIPPRRRLGVAADRAGGATARTAYVSAGWAMEKRVRV